MADVYNRVAMLVDGDLSCALRMVRNDRLVLEVANVTAGTELIITLMQVARIQGYLSLGRDNKTWFVTIPQ